MKPQPGGPPGIGDMDDLDILSKQLDQIGKNCGGIKELATKVDELVNIIISCPHCRKKLLDRRR